MRTSKFGPGTSSSASSSAFPSSRLLADEYTRRALGVANGNGDGGLLAHLPSLAEVAQTVRETSISTRIPSGPLEIQPSKGALEEYGSSSKKISPKTGEKLCVGMMKPNELRASSTVTRCRAVHTCAQGPPSTTPGIVLPMRLSVNGAACSNVVVTTSTAAFATAAAVTDFTCEMSVYTKSSDDWTESSQK
ncbi:hypothetical protein K438DRAFT_1770778 [Mycena galopus ATCC 62051]|nr:hypothetical protein K438DRAFT_1770778 [Mycena galopus ATCC 62051]